MLFKRIKSFFSYRRPFRRILPQSLFGRSLLIIIVPVLLIQLISTYIFFERHWSKMTERLAQGVAGEIALLVDKFYDLAGTDTQLTELARLANKMDLTLQYLPQKALDKQQKAWQKGVQKEMGIAMQERIQHNFYVGEHIRREWVEISIELENGLLKILIPERRLFSSTGYVFLLWMIGSAALLSLIAILFMRNQIRPIRQLARAADRFGRGLEVPKFRERGAREVRQAAAAFEKMRERIARQIEQRTTMLAGVSHDLRTPLTRIKLELEMCNDNELAESIKKDIRDMERMIDGYLDFARGDENTEVARLIDFSSFMAERVDSLVKQGGKVKAKIDDNISISLRTTAFRRCIDNIFSNARKYASHIWVRVHQLNEKTIEITIDDDGIGIPENYLEDVFKPFFRIDESRNTETGGVGLGLSITKDIIHAHGGRIWLEKSDKGGVRAVIHMPLAKQV